MNKRSLLEGYPEQFSFDEFNAIRSYAKKLKYANSHLTKIATGSARVVYKVDETKALKIAKNRKGLAQNEVESSWGMENYGITAQVFERNEDFFWLEMELAKKTTPTRFKQLTGLSKDELDKAVRALMGRLDHNAPQYKLDKDFEDRIYENEFYTDLETFTADFGMSAGDFGRLSSYGEVIREGSPSIVLVDFGLTKTVWNDFYRVKV